MLRFSKTNKALEIVSIMMLLVVGIVVGCSNPITADTQTGTVTNNNPVNNSSDFNNSSSCCTRELCTLSPTRSDEVMFDITGSQVSEREFSSFLSLLDRAQEDDSFNIIIEMISDELDDATLSEIYRQTLEFILEHLDDPEFVTQNLEETILLSALLLEDLSCGDCITTKKLRIKFWGKTEKGTIWIGIKIEF